MTTEFAFESTEWWDARKKILNGIAIQSRKRKVRWTERDVKRSEAAVLCSLNDEEGKITYERNGFTREQWLAKWWPAGLTGEEISMEQKVSALRESMDGTTREIR